jgi:hypothetical protein
MDIDELVAAFDALPGTQVGAGPRHPVTPDPALTPRLTAFFAEFPGLARDPGYVDFMWKYGGMSRSDPEQNRLFYVHGFGAATADFDEDLDGPVVDEQGFFVFAESVVHADTAERHDTYEYSFAFNLARDRPAGIYRFAATMSAQDRGFLRHADDFRSFLEETAANGGVWERPALG